MKGIFLLLGSNMGNRTENLQKALQLFVPTEIQIVDYSSVYETAPWGNPDQDWFLNMVIRVDTMLQPHELLNATQEIENQLGRKRVKKWGSRTMDIDILYYDNLELEDENLTIPHPGIAMRKFAVLPMSEVAAGEIHPILKLSQKEMLDVCPDELECRKVNIKLSL